MFLVGSVSGGETLETEKWYSGERHGKIACYEAKKPLLDGRCPLKCSWFSKILRLLAVFNVAFPNALPVLFPASISLQAPVDSQTPRRSEDSQSPSHSQTIPEHIQLTAFHLLPANGNFGNRYTR